MIRTQATPEQVAAFKTMIRGDASSRRGGKRAGCAPPPEHKLVHGSYISWPDGVELQLPIDTDSGVSQGRIRGGLAMRLKASQRNVTAVELITHGFKIDRDRIVRVTLTRISPNGSVSSNNMDDDNLPPTLKPVRDAAARWIVEGPRCVGLDGKLNTHSLGDFDRLLKKQRGFQWDYAQLTHELDRRLYGVRIRFHLRPR